VKREREGGREERHLFQQPGADKVEYFHCRS
jgi:hypothetical protein